MPEPRTDTEPSPTLPPDMVVDPGYAALSGQPYYTGMLPQQDTPPSPDTPYGKAVAANIRAHGPMGPAPVNGGSQPTPQPGGEPDRVIRPSPIPPVQQIPPAPSRPPASPIPPAGGDASPLMMTPTLDPRPEHPIHWAEESFPMRTRIDELWRAMPDQLKQGTYVTSAFRTYDEQAAARRRYETGQGGIAALPGHSFHEKGEAVDWHFTNPAASEWMHQNASKFGFEFPENLRDSDPNHMQLAETADKTKYGVPLLQRTMLQLESSGGTDRTIANTYDPNFPDRPVGPAQIKMETFRTAARGNEDINNTQDNINVGNRLLATYFTKYGGDMDKALIAYNAGEKYVGRPYSELPQETKDYLEKAHKLWNDGAAIDRINATTVGGTEAHNRYIAAIDDNIAQGRKEQEQLIKLMNQTDPLSPERHEMMRRHHQMMDRLEQMYLDKAEHPPTRTQPDMLANFGSLATVAAILGGFMAHRPIVASLNAAGSAMEALNTNNYEQYKESYSTWTKQSDMISKALEMEHSAYRDILDDEKTSLAEKQQRIHDAATIFQNAQVLRNLEQGKWKEISEWPDKQAKTQADLDHLRAQSEELRAREEKEHAEAARIQQFGAYLNPSNETDRDVYAELSAQATREGKDVGDLIRNPGAIQDARGRVERRKSAERQGVSPEEIEKYGPYLSPKNEADRDAYTQLAATAQSEGKDVATLAHDPVAVEKARGEIEKRKAVERQGVTISEDTALQIAGAVGKGNTTGLTRLNQASRDLVYQMVRDQELPNSIAYFTEKEGHAPNEEELKQLKYGIGVRLATAAGEFQGFNAYERFLGTREASIHAAVIEAQKFIPLAREAAAKLNWSKYPDMNALYKAWQTHTGDPNVTELVDYTNTILNIYSRAVAPVGQTTDKVRDMAEQQLKATMGRDQFERALKVMELEMGVALAAPQQARDQRRMEFERSGTIVPVMPASFWAKGLAGGAGGGGGATVDIPTATLDQLLELSGRQDLTKLQHDAIEKRLKEIGH